MYNSCQQANLFYASRRDYIPTPQHCCRSIADPESQAIRLVEEAESHVVIGLLLGLLLLLLGGCGITTSGRGSSAASSRGSTASRANVHEQVLDVLALEGLGEQSGPDGLDVGNTCGGDERLELLGLGMLC